MCVQFKDKESQEVEIQRQVLFPGLLSLNLNANRIMRLPTHIRELRALKSLYLNTNTKLTEVGWCLSFFL